MSVRPTPFLLLAALLPMGCARSLRDDATKIAAQGATTANQMGDYYGTLIDDTVDTYRLDTGRKYAYAYVAAHLPNEAGALPTPPAVSDTFDQPPLQAQYEELRKRAVFARKLRGLFDAFSSLANYDAADAVSTRIDELAKTADGLGLLKPAGPGATPNAATIGLDAIKDFVRNLRTVEENRRLVKDNRVALKLMGNVRAFFAAEAPLYRDIARDKATALTSVRRMLVTGEAVISTGLFGDVLGTGLRFPEPQSPFKDGNLKAFALGLLAADDAPLAQTSADAGEALLGSLDDLMALQTQFGHHQTLSLAESAQQSLTVKDLLDKLKAKGGSGDDLQRLLGALAKAGTP